jgi:hypothetical protein
MGLVDIDTLRWRILMAGRGWDELGRKSDTSGGMLARHETWSREYFHDPYLIGANDERLAERFRDVFINQTELTDEAQIGMLRPGKSDFMRKFKHVMEEYSLRGGVPGEVVENARAPLHRYFENGGPIANRIFNGFNRPNDPFYVKYGRREFLEPMLREGRVRICPASYYGDASHNEAVRDDEISRIFYVSTYLERLQGISHVQVQGHRIPIGDDDIVLPIRFPDYFLMSLCDDIYYRMPTDFDADAALIITDPHRFTQRVISTFLARFPDWRPLHGPVTYFDPYRDYSAFTVPEMGKPFSYSYQREVRIVFKPTRPVTAKLQPEMFEIGPIGDLAVLLSV